MSVAAPDDLMTGRRIGVTADIAAESSEQANGNVEIRGCGQSFFLA